jgi:Bacteriophage minor capsid protein
MLLSEITQLLEVNGIGVRGTDLFAGEIPAHASQACVGLLETGGRPPQFVHNQNQRLAEAPGFQVLVRSADYEAAREKCEAIVRLLTFRNQTLSGVRYHSIVPVQSPIDLGRDGNELHKVACNFDVIKEPSPS